MRAVQGKRPFARFRADFTSLDLQRTRLHVAWSTIQ